MLERLETVIVGMNLTALISNSFDIVCVKLRSHQLSQNSNSKIAALYFCILPAQRFFQTYLESKLSFSSIMTRPTRMIIYYS